MPGCALQEDPGRRDLLEPWTAPSYQRAHLLHPTAKPVDLLRWLIRTYSHPGGRVLDPFMGSGTTAKTARLNKRHYLGCDISQEYVDLANRRLAQAYTARMFE